ncbi:MAG: acyl carrier protein [Campylobacterota bacterium]|nr:acyl carrier protein [Campylobacterota bacterium]
MEEKIIQIASELFGKEVTLETKIGDIEAWDSLGQINLFMAIESELNLSFEPEDVIESDSIIKVNNLINRS